MSKMKTLDIHRQNLKLSVRRLIADWGADHHTLIGINVSKYPTTLTVQEIMKDISMGKIWAKVLQHLYQDIATAIDEIFQDITTSL